MLKLNSSSTPFVSVIIPVFNDHEGLERCLQALEKQTYPARLYEIIVVDNGSDKSIEQVVARFRQAQFAFESCPSSYAARNRGIAIATGKVIAFTDSDCLPFPDWIEKGVANLLGTPNCGLVAGKIEMFSKNPQRPTPVELYEITTYLIQDEYVKFHSFGATANLFTSRTVFERVGIFDGETKSSGDLEWGQRVASSGYKLIYADDARVAHPARATFGQLYRKAVRVIGGYHDLKRKRRRVVFGANDRGLVSSFLPPISYPVYIWREPKLKSVGDKIKVVAVIFFVRYVEAWEKLRLKLGGKSKR